MFFRKNKSIKEAEIKELKEEVVALRHEVIDYAVAHKQLMETNIKLEREIEKLTTTNKELKEENIDILERLHKVLKEAVAE